MKTLPPEIKSAEEQKCIFCGLPYVYQNNTCCPNGCANNSIEWKEIRLLRNDLTKQRDLAVWNAAIDKAAEVVRLSSPESRQAILNLKRKE